MQKYLFQWLNNNAPFFQGFLGLMKDNGLINYGYQDNKLENYFFSDFVVTDLVKCMAKTGDIDEDREDHIDHIEKCAELYLCKELKNYASNKLIFAFSTRTWGYLYNKFSPKLVSDRGTTLDLSKVSNVHGMLFRSVDLNAYLIPLAHFSQRQFNNYLRESYFDYLDEELKEYTRVKSGGI